MKKEQFIKISFLLVILIVNIAGFIPLHHIDTGGLAVFLFLVLFFHSWKLVHCALLLFLMSTGRIFFIRFNLQISAIQFLVLFVVSTLMILPFKATRPALSWIRAGRLDRTLWILISLTGALSTIALIVWAALWTDSLGIGQEIVEGFAHVPRWIILLAGLPAFALMNALAEEIIYRGILQQALMKTFSVNIALVLQSTAFAAMHFAAGFPNGYIGYGMVFVYGIMLGYLRVRSQGMLAPYLTHVIADLVIGYYLYAAVILA